MKIAIIGAGVGGMAAAFDLIRAGHQVTIYEAAPIVGGLSAGIKEPQWDWSVEQFYHHWFTTDKDMLGLLKELGWQDKVVFNRPQTVAYHDGKFFPLDSPLAALKFPGFNLLDMARFGFVSAYLRYFSPWKPLEEYSADEWMKRWYGTKLYRTLFEPLLIGKFGKHSQEVNMAWFWARFKSRSTRLGTFQGGFQAFVDAFADELRRLGVVIHLSSPVRQIVSKLQGKLSLLVDNETNAYDRCLVTVSPTLLTRLAPTLPRDYLEGLFKLKSMGAVVMVLSLKKPLSPEAYYWYSLPKSAGFPFLALVEHTNFLPPEHFGGEHIIYMGDYLDVDHENFHLSKDELLAKFLPSLGKINPDFKPEWINKSWLFRTQYAQPIPLLEHSRNIPTIKTPIPGLYFASMSQVYPWDRGTNFAVQVARRAAKEMLAV